MADDCPGGWILALDTGSPVISVALGRDGETLAARSAEQARASTHLVAMIEHVLRQAEVAPRALAGVVALGGPGSYTGLRIGLATALGLSQGLDLVAGAIGTLPLLASLGGEEERVFGAVRGLRGGWFLAERGAAAPFALHHSDLAALAPATLVGFGMSEAAGIRPGLRALEPPPLAPALLRFVAQRRPALRPETLLEPLYLGPALAASVEERDAARLARVEAASFAAPWSEGQLRDALAQAGALALAAPGPAAPIAYALFRSLGGGEAELLRIAVHPEHRRRGLGARLLGDGLARLAARGVATCFLEVEATNLAALELYRRFGFAPVGRRRSYTAGGGDAVLMRRTAG